MSKMTRSSAIALVAGAAAAPYVARADSATVRVGASPAATQAEAYYADQLGFFKQAGLITEQQIVTRSADTLQLVVSGNLDVGSTAPQSIANAIIHGFPLRVIAAGAVYAGNPPPVQFCVAKTTASNDPHYYANATIGVQTLNDSQSVGVLAWFRQNKVPTDKVKFIELPFPTMPEALQRSEILGCCMVEPFASARKDITRSIPNVYDILGKNWALGVWYAKIDWIQANPQLVKTFVNALYATARKVNADPSSVDQLLSTYSKVPLDSIKQTLKPIFAEKQERSNVEPQMLAAAEFKLISRPVSYDEMTGL
jgi:NitT/TauT family transport system substrate-binding protein